MDMNLFYQEIESHRLDQKILNKIQTECLNLWKNKYFLLREVSPPNMFGCALFSTHYTHLNRYESYGDPAITESNANWTEAAELSPVLTNYLKELPFIFSRVNLWHMTKGYLQAWHTDSVNSILHICIQHPKRSDEARLVWEDNGSLVFDRFTPGGVYLINPRIKHMAFNNSMDSRFQIIAFLKNPPTPPFIN